MNNNKLQRNVDSGVSSSQSNQVSPNQGDVSSVPENNIKRNNKKIFKYALLVAGVVALCFVLFSLFINKNDNKNGNSNSAQKSADFFPRFDSIADFVKFDGADWYAVPGGVIRIKDKSHRFYTHNDGVTLGRPTSFAVHNNNLWLGTQNGTSYLNNDQNGFVEVSVEAGTGETINNGIIFSDEKSQTLFFSTFSGSYRLDNQSNKWVADSNIPRDVISYANNDKYLVASGAGSNQKLMVFNKASSNWGEEKISLFEDQSARVFSLDGNIFALGRSKGYESCESAGKVTASSVAVLGEDGKWQPLSKFNQDKQRSELNVLPSLKDQSMVRLETYPICNTRDKSMRYDVTYSNGELKLSNPKTIAPGDEQPEQKQIVKELSELTGLFPFYRVYGVDGQGNLVVGYSSKYSDSSTVDDEGLAILSKDDFKNATKIDLKNESSSTVKIPVMCGEGSNRKLSYVFSGLPENADEIGPSGSWSKTKIFKMQEGTKTELFSEITTSIQVAKFDCNNDKLTWVSSEGIKQLDLGTRKINSSGVKLPENNTEVLEVAYTRSGNLWLLTKGNNKKANIVFVDLLNKQVKVVLEIEAQDVHLGVASDEFVWVTQYNSDDSTTDTLKYSKSGKILYQISGFGPAITSLIDDNKTMLLNPSVSYVVSKYDLKIVNDDNRVIENKKETLAYHEIYHGVTKSPLSPTVNIYDFVRNGVWISDDGLGAFFVLVAE